MEKFGIVIIACIVLFFVGCNSQAYEFYEFPFEDVSGNVTTYYGVLKYNGNEKKVVIPEKHNNCDVRYLFSECFFGNNLESVDVSLVKHVSDYSFKNCNFLHDVDLRSVESLGTHAFYGCKRLKSIVIPETVVSIKAGAFSLCEMLESVYFRGNPNDLEPGIFDNKNIIIYGPSGGFVEQYAVNEGLTFCAWKGQN